MDVNVLGERLLIVEDNRMQREELSRFLRYRGFETMATESAELSIAAAETLSPDVVLMDVSMPEGIDGIDAALEIQRRQPHVSILMVTAYADDIEVRQKALTSGLRIAGWIEKPFTNRLEELVHLIQKEAKKARLRTASEIVESQGFDVAGNLRALAAVDPTITPDIVEELLNELEARNDMPIEWQIDRLYDGIRELVGRSAAEPAMKSEINPLVRHLRELQTRGADRMESRFQAQLLIKLGEGYRAVVEARRLLLK